MDERWVRALRAQFPVTEKTAFFDIAYENCGSRFAREAMERFYEDKAAVGPGLVKAGGAGKGPAIEVIARTRARLARFLGAPDIRRIAFTKNTNEGVNLLLQGFPFRRGDSVVVGDLEHASVLMPCLNVRRLGAECRVARSPDGCTLPEELLLSAADETTRIMVVSAVQSCSGYQLDLKRLAGECHTRGIYLIVDGIQALGFRRMDVSDLGIDALTASCYKGLLATEGVGFLYCAQALMEQVAPVFAADSPALGIDRESWSITCPDPGDARKLENGTISFMGIYGLDAGLERLMEIGMDRVERHVSDCFEYLYRGLEGLGFVIDTPFLPARRCHSLLVREQRSQELVDYCLERGVLFSRGRDGHVRISVAPFTTRGDMDKLLDTFRQWKLA